MNAIAIDFPLLVDAPRPTARPCAKTPVRVDQPDVLAQLLQRSAGGDPCAFQALYEAAAPQLYAVARRMLRRADLADEALQDTFVRVWKHAGDFDAALASPMTWMNSILRNRCLDVLRQPARERSLDDGDFDVDTVADDAPGPADFAVRAQDARGVAVALARLPHHEREAIELAFFGDLTHAEVAERMGAPLGTAKTWIRRGLERLRALHEARR
ncbi:MAG: RNA polymerase sigma factor [Burkholderiales bacterium]|jgi:RNA polymerase sigma-70 factor (ECF subfamily)|nr:RNA polymerase sigma factor [Burkholderiales bacterium]